MDAMIVIYVDIEGLTANKTSILSELWKDKNFHCLCLPESQRSSKAHTTNMEVHFFFEIRDRLKVNSISVKRIMLS